MRDALRAVLFSPSGLRLSLRPQGRRGSRRNLQHAAAAGEAAFPRRHPPSFPAVPETVSVLIPTLNAGDLFPRVLAAVRSQTGLGAVELIVVDSASTDATVDVAAEAGARVTKIARKDYGHGRTRNLAAEQASGDVLLLLAQDAVLLGARTVRELVLELRDDEGIAAVSARQVPRSDADLYAAFQVFAHNRVMDDAYEAAGRKRFQSLNAVQRRAAARVDNVCAAVRRPAWQEFRFSDTAFAEDLDFGLRAVKQGWRVTTSARAVVAHSHDRGAPYAMRRSVADRVYIASIVGDERLARAADHGPDLVLASGRSLVASVQGACPSSRRDAAPLLELLRAFQSALGADTGRVEPVGELAALAATLASHDGGVGGGDRDVERLLREDLVRLLDWPPLLEFARAHTAVPPDAAESFVAKLTALSLGRTVGDAFRRAGEPARAATFIGRV